MSELIDLTQDAFKTLVSDETRPVLVDFWSPTCGPCRLLAPVIAKLAQENEGKAVVMKCNVFDNMELAASLNVSVVPTIIVFKNKEIVARLTGVQKQSKLQELIDANL
ncbi:MAG: thioredoxin [Thermoguttaceae bacterium]|nr:thioredoxin [Thermoguttaceae bacterium]